MSQKIVVCSASESEKKIQLLLDAGYYLVDLIAENVSTSVSVATSSYSKSDSKTEKGLIIYILDVNS